MYSHWQKVVGWGTWKEAKEGTGMRSLGIYTCLYTSRRGEGLGWEVREASRQGEENGTRGLGIYIFIYLLFYFCSFVSFQYAKEQIGKVEDSMRNRWKLVKPYANQKLSKLSLVSNIVLHNRYSSCCLWVVNVYRVPNI